MQTQCMQIPKLSIGHTCISTVSCMLLIHICILACMPSCEGMSSKCHQTAVSRLTKFRKKNLLNHFVQGFSKVKGKLKNTIFDIKTVARRHVFTPISPSY